MSGALLATVTGASGFVGGNLVRELLARGMSVRAADRERGPALEGLDVEFVALDVLEPDSLRAAFAGTDVVFHLAAVISISGDPTGIVRRVNVEGPANAAAAALEQNVRRFVHCSSVHTFDLERCGPSLDERGPLMAKAGPRRTGRFGLFSLGEHALNGKAPCTTTECLGFSAGSATRPGRPPALPGSPWFQGALLGVHRVAI